MGPKAKEMLSRQKLTNAVISSLALIGVDTTHYSGLSMRRGGGDLGGGHGSGAGASHVLAVGVWDLQRGPQLHGA